MPYNHYNNDLPVPPSGFADWRAAYASAKDFLGKYEGAYKPQEQVVEFAPKMDWHFRDPQQHSIGSDLKLIEVPYWKLAHYAAREQADYDEANPPLSMHQLHKLLHAFMNAPSNGPQDTQTLGWLQKQLKQARAAERPR